MNPDWSFSSTGRDIRRRASARKNYSAECAFAKSCRLSFRFRDGNKIKSLAKFFAHLCHVRPNLVYVVDMSFSGVIAAVLYRSVAWRSRLVIDSGDAISALAKKMGDRGGPSLLLTAFLEKLGQLVADKLVVRGTNHLTYLNGHSRKATVIQDGVDVKAYDMVTPVDLQGTFTADAPLVVGVLGSLIWDDRQKWCYGAELVEAVGLLKDQPVCGIIVGDGNGLAHLKRRVDELNIVNRIRFIDRVPRNRLASVLEEMHVALSTQTNDIVGQVRTTGKLPLYLASGRFVLASRVGEAGRLLPDEMLVDYEGEFDKNYPRRLAGAIEELAIHKSKLASAEAGPDIARQLDYDILAQRLDEVLSSLAPKFSAQNKQKSAILYLVLGVHRTGGMDAPLTK